ncbi:meiosis 1 arrest protein [Hippocampus comes]|uniref:meiosis 1 arrest protein n=1 Tax=Hippocampus comes TaxID=109280 RepID=UPI00094DFEC9|nr:PREDICTED: meiosis 1 arrest protein [Hippocampus comes]
MDHKKSSGFSNTTFLRQPARVLIIEAMPPWWSKTRSVLCDALDNFLTLVCSLKGPCRLPFLSVFAISSQQECLLPFVRVRGNLPRLLSCVEALRAIPSEGVTTELASVGEMLRQTVLDGQRQFNQYRKFSGVDIQTNISVEVTVVTSRPGKGMVCLLKNVLKDDDLDPINGFLVVQLSSQVEWGQDGLPPQEPPQACSADNLVLVDLHLVDSSVFALEGVFKNWLQEYGVDSEHIHLVLPSPRGSPGPVCIKCDMRERVISPGSLPLNPSEKPESLCDVMSVSQVPRRMRAIKALYKAGVCQSVLYGLPLVVIPTACWRLNWDEIETNQHRFQALNRTLQDQGQVLLLQVGPTDGDSDLCSFYFLYPSPSLAMLLKPVVCRELFMPGAYSEPMREPPPEAMQVIMDCLSQIKEKEVLSPCSLNSNLYQHLRSILVTKLHYPLGPSTMLPAIQTYQRQPPESAVATANSQSHQAHQLGMYSKVKSNVAPEPPSLQRTLENSRSAPLRPPTPLRPHRRALTFVRRSSSCSSGHQASAPAPQEGSDKDGTVTLAEH